MQICQSLIGGQLVASALPAIDKIYPATGETIAKIEPATADMLDDAVACAAAAQRSWAAYEPLARARILHRAAALMREANAELAQLEVMDVGKLYAEAETADVPSGTDAFDFFAAAITTQSGDYNKWDGAVSYTSRVPLGVCAGIGAWNYPMQIACWKSAPALAAGNAFILKPSEMTPLVAHKVADILSEAGLPDGLFQIIHGTQEIGRAICEHPGIAKISLTGGVATGKLIMSQSASTLKKITLELGGKSPLLVFDDCDFELAVQTALDANFYTAGEVCSNATRVFVQRSIADKFIAAMVDRTERMVVGDPMAADVNMGALISASHLGKVLDYVKIGRAEGAQIATGGKQILDHNWQLLDSIDPLLFGIEQHAGLGGVGADVFVRLESGWHRLDFDGFSLDSPTTIVTAAQLPQAMRAEHLPRHLQGERNRSISWQRVLLDLHSGRWFGSWGIWLVDLAALILAFLSMSGFWIWWSRQRKR